MKSSPSNSGLARTPSAVTWFCKFALRRRAVTRCKSSDLYVRGSTARWAKPICPISTVLSADYRSRSTLVVRAANDPHAALSAIQQQVNAVDPQIAPFDLETMKEYMVLPLFAAHTMGVLLGAFGGLALVLAMSGLYAVMSFVVAQRTREIGVHMAFGASRRDVLNFVVGQALRLTLIGVAIGLTGALGATRFLRSLLYGVGATDPVTFVFVPLVLAGVALAASYIPARRAAKVDPMVALRYE